MQKIVPILIVCFCFHKGNSINMGLKNKPLVYVVTPSSRSLQIDEGRSAPFYYHNWMRRMDSPENVTTTTIQPTQKVKTPDLIFAEFESDNGDNMRKSIRKLLEKEKTKTETTTEKPIYVPEESDIKQNNEEEIYRIPPYTNENDDVKTSSTTPDMTDYFALYSNVYNNGPAPLYTPPTTPSTTTKSTSRTPTSTPTSVENIWHIIDNEKRNPNLHSWIEVPINSNEAQQTDTSVSNENEQKDKGQDDQIYDNFAIPGFGTYPGNGAENESRAIRTEPNMRFPYVNLKPFQIKNFKKPLSTLNSKNANAMFNLNNFQEIKHPIRGEAQDVVPMRQPIDRYNPAQPHLPSAYGSKSKQSVPNSTPVKAVANLVPPPLPLPPKVTGNDFPALTSYESFPPYDPSPSIPDTALPPPPSFPAAALKPSLTMLQPPVNIPDSSDSNSRPVDDGPPMDLGYRYKPPSQVFLPTLPPAKKPFKGYSYDKPIMTADMSPTPDTDDKPDFQGYHYDKPESPSPPEDHAPSHYGYDSHHEIHSHSHYEDQDYPELIFNKHHGDMKDAKENDEKANDDSGMGMMPPPPPPPDMGDVKPDMDAGSPMDDHGFPDDFPGNFKYHHHFDDDDHDFYHHHHHTTTTTTTTTTEMPRVNRYSYYYLGKKLYYLPLYFSVYFIVYVGALVIKAILRHKIVYPNSFRPNDQTAGFFSKRSVDSWDLTNENLHEITGKITHAIGQAAEKYLKK